MCDSCATCAPREVEARLLKSKKLTFLLQILDGQRKPAMVEAVEAVRNGAINDAFKEEHVARYGLSHSQVDELIAWAVLEVEVELEPELEPEPEPEPEPVE